MSKIGTFKQEKPQEFKRDTIRLPKRKGYKAGDLVDDFYADKISKKAGWWKKGSYYDVADMSEVMIDKRGPYVVNLKQNEYFRPGNTDYKN
jgi:hypothetical protein